MTQPEGKPAIAQGVSSVSHCAPPTAVKALTCGVSGYVQETGITSFSLTVFLCAKCYCFCCSVDEEFGKS